MAKKITADVISALASECELGEGPVWDSTRGVLWFVDIKRCQLWRFNPQTREHSVADAPGQIGWALPAESGQLLCGLQDGLYTFDPDASAFTKLCDVPGEPAGNRLNDACTDPWGRVWFGSMDDAEAKPSGRFYVFDRGDIRAAGPRGITITNGPAIDGDGSRIYFTDTLGQTIYVAPLSAAGCGKVREFVSIAPHFPHGYPDGPVVDCEGFVWSGLFVAGHAIRLSPDGELVATVEMPAKNITKLAFGGADLKTAYITTARKGLDDTAISKRPMSGNLLQFASPVAGLATPLAKLG